MKLKKTWFELCALVALISCNMYVLLTHTYFKITDVRIQGLDAESSTLARSIVNEYVQTHRYPVLREINLAKELQKKLALDQLIIIKKFPHTLEITASEIPIRARIYTANGIASVSQLGEVVRWNATTSTENYIDLIPKIKINITPDDHELGMNILDSQILKKILLMHERAAHMNSSRIRYISVMDNPFDRVELKFENELTLIAKLSGDAEPQLQKAFIAIQKYPKAREIDVRYTDKVFVSF